MKLEGIGALVTGASRGLGEALARELAARGVRVAMVARGRERLEAAAASIRDAARTKDSGGAAFAVPGDVGLKQDVHPIVGAASGLVGELSLVIHNASTLGPVPLRPLMDTDCEDVERALAVNVLGPLRLTKATAGAMALRGHGVVVSVTSDAAVEAYPEWGAYGLSKAALEHLSRTFDAELAETGVRFLTVDPGEMDTRMHADAMPEADPSSLARPEDVARALVDRLAQEDAVPGGARLSIRGGEVQA